MDRYLMISSDGHAGPRPEVYRDYLDPQYRAEFDVQHPQMKPSEYFRRNVRVGSSAMSRREAELRHEIGLQVIM